MTFNITLWLTMLGIIGVMLVGLSGRRIRVIRYSTIFKLLFVVAILGLFLMAFFPTFRERVLGIFIFGTRTAGAAGNSLYWRLQNLENSFRLIKEYPYGLGLQVREAITGLQNQRGWFLVTSDIFFTWLALIGGLPLLISYLLLLISYLWSSYRRRVRIPVPEQPLFWAIWAFVFVGVLLGGISNAALINGTPTNLLTWASIGVGMKLVDKKYSRSGCK